MYLVINFIEYFINMLQQHKEFLLLFYYYYKFCALFCLLVLCLSLTHTHTRICFCLVFGMLHKFPIVYLKASFFIIMLLLLLLFPKRFNNNFMFYCYIYSYNILYMMRYICDFLHSLLLCSSLLWGPGILAGFCVMLE